jgi:hypothetical protein
MMHRSDASDLWVLITAIESARDREFSSNGIVSAVRAIASDAARGRNPGGSIADLLIIVAGDSMMGKTGARIQRNLTTTKVPAALFAASEPSDLTAYRWLSDLSG